MNEYFQNGFLKTAMRANTFAHRAAEAARIGHTVDESIQHAGTKAGISAEAPDPTHKITALGAAGGGGLGAIIGGLIALKQKKVMPLLAGAGLGTGLGGLAGWAEKTRQEQVKSDALLWQAMNRNARIRQIFRAQEEREDDKQREVRRLERRVDRLEGEQAV